MLNFLCVQHSRVCVCVCDDEFGRNFLLTSVEDPKGSAKNRNLLCDSHRDYSSLALEKQKRNLFYKKKVKMMMSFNC